MQKDTDDLNVFFAHLGSLLVKAALKMLMKLTPDFCVLVILLDQKSYSLQSQLKMSV